MPRWINGTSELDFKDKSFINLLSREQEKIRKKNWKKIVAKISPKIIPKIVQKSSQQSPKKSPQNPTNISQNNCRIALKSLSLSKCVRKCKKYKKLSDWELCMVGCRNYGVTKKTSSYPSPCTAKSNSMWKFHSIKSKKTQIFMSLLFEWPLII